MNSSSEFSKAWKAEYKMCKILLFLITIPSLYSMEFQSLWLTSKRDSWPQLKSDLNCDVAVVGGGISGVATLYYLLTTTEKKVALFERDFVACGATGHNAGLPLAYIEKPVAELIKEYGFELVKEAYTELDQGMEFLYVISKKIGFESELFSLPVSYFELSSVDMLLQFLEEDQLSSQVRDQNFTYFVIDKKEIKEQIPLHFHEKLQFVSEEKNFNNLQVSNTNCMGVAVEIRNRVRMNSALFCEKILHYLSEEFPKRYQVYEKCAISQINLGRDEQVLQHAFGKVFTKDVILCTNAYTDFIVVDEQSGKTVTKLRDQIMQKEGFLASYPNKEASSFLRGFMNETASHATVPYWYISNAPLSNEDPSRVALIGGPEYTLTAPLSFDMETIQTQESLRLMKEVLKDRSENPFSFFWHGTMGYTQNGLRWIGEDTEYPHLWYNLGCNGIGILPALIGGEKIARKITGEIFSKSIFDPPR